MVKIRRIADLAQQDGKNMWLVEDDQGRRYAVRVDHVSASNTAFWAWRSCLQEM